MPNKFNKIIIFSLALFLIFAFKASGQVNTGALNGAGDSVDVTTAPEFPGANQDVSVRAESFSFDINSSEIIWALDGIIKDKGIGKKDFSFKTGTVGSVSLLKIIIKTKEGKTIEKSLVVRPAGVDILWQADSYVPPFYKGKALYGYQSLITVIALPNIINSDGMKINPDDLIYKWTKDSKVLGEVSGYGKNKFSFSAQILSHSPEIEVEVSSSDKKIKASGSITLEAIEPKTVIYEDNPLYGIIYEKAVAGDFKLNGNEITLTATPYFFSNNAVDDKKIKYGWNMNGQNIGGGKGGRRITFRNVDAAKGSTAISVDLQNEESDLQSARTDAMLNYDGSGGSAQKAVSF
ncbi:MAG: hypothetical protein KGJ58_01010 [Patescibacteria group bacterium]|nr:hypothetical protein [Patescibacteria group bacterium]MDE1988182.1 hypothetical protein [Patescibacteria group bacterium]MDE2218020.1 hypothetical protein [Patescibacteria group bacterium]